MAILKKNGLYDSKYGGTILWDNLCKNLRIFNENICVACLQNRSLVGIFESGVIRD